MPGTPFSVREYYSRTGFYITEENISKSLDITDMVLYNFWDMEHVVPSKSTYVEIGGFVE